MPLVPYVLLGAGFGVLLVEAEAVSWFRMQEMFRFHAFHMYGVLATAVATAALSLAALRALGLHDAAGAPLCLPPKQLGSGVRYLAGGTMFGVGWALIGACPGPLAALLGAGVPVMIVVVAAALAGTWTYAYLRPRLPH